MAFKIIRVVPNRNRTFFDKLASSMMPAAPAYAYARVTDNYRDMIALSKNTANSNAHFFLGFPGGKKSPFEKYMSMITTAPGVKGFLDKVKKGEVDLDKFSNKELTSLAVQAAETDPFQTVSDITMFRKIGDKGMASVATIVFRESPSLLANNLSQFGIENLHVLRKIVLAVAHEKPEHAEQVLAQFFDKLDEFFKKSEKLDITGGKVVIYYPDYVIRKFKALQMEELFMELTEVVPGMASKFIQRSNIGVVKDRAKIALAEAKKSGVALAQNWKNYKINPHPEDKTTCALVAEIMLAAFAQDPKRVEPYLESFNLQTNLIPGLREKLHKIRSSNN